MRKYIFMLLFGIFFLVGCNNQKKSKEASNNDAAGQAQVTELDTSEEVEGAIDDSGEILADSTQEIDAE